MHVIRAINVNDALPKGLRLLIEQGKLQDSRAGEVLCLPEPVTTIYAHPDQKVLFSPLRDANPFFHLIEALWMLTGQSSTSLLNCYVSDFGKRYAEDDGVLHGAYGYRWRESFAIDQLSVIIKKLKENNFDRQVVLQMWDAGPEFAGGQDDLMGVWRDRPCNTHVYFRADRGSLDMTVCCRSNDIIWGAYGANAVHFGFLLEYMAAAIDIPVGRYYQISNNFHAYVSELDRLSRGPGSYVDLVQQFFRDGQEEKYAPFGVSCFSFMKDQEIIDNRLRSILLHVELINSADKVFDGPHPDEAYYIDSIFINAAKAHRLFKLGDHVKALAFAQRIPAPDWALACTDWIKRRIK